ncbi:sentrin-specific protease 1-like [Galendromus occidentalis]|uniref:Sentrin-specific protease 1-like n=1 Tax=Galendromus occidentalis TaxID=34638 RepID=A0AAJ7PB35_9ACAR|nr:sentrin-specific protease 1-like [Galendromus occidentalis]
MEGKFLPTSSCFIPPISEEMILVIKEAFRSPASQVLVDVSRQAVTRADLETLLGLNWLNDAIINVYLNLIVNRSKEAQKLPKVYAFNTFFLTRYIEMGYSAVRRWTRRDDIFAHDILLVPVHLGMHWCMAIVDLRVKQIKYMDSMGGRNDACLATLLEYLSQEMSDKKNSQLDAGQWLLTNIQNLPQQQNGSDCGMFALKYADFAAKDAEINFTQNDMPYFRRRMMFEILRSSILPSGYGEK